METKSMLIKFLSRASSDDLNKMCNSTPCWGKSCADCPFSSLDNAKLAVKELIEWQQS